MVLVASKIGVKQPHDLFCLNLVPHRLFVPGLGGGGADLRVSRGLENALYKQTPPVLIILKVGGSRIVACLHCYARYKLWY